MHKTFKLIPILFVIFYISTICNGQTIPARFKVSGKIIDARTQKPLKKIPLLVLPFNKTIETNNEGKFLFDMPKNIYSFEIDFYPYEKKIINLDLVSDTTLLVKLYSPFVSQYIDEFEVLTNKPQTDLSAGIDKINGSEIIKIPTLIGEKDLIKALQLNTGVTSSSEGAADLQVRGGNHGQNLFLMDDIPLYATQHFFGMVSVYNPLTIKSVKLYKAAFPAEYGGKVSSIIDVRTKDTNFKKWSCEADISLLTTKASLNIPILENKIAFVISGRIANYGCLNLMAFSSIEQSTKLKMNFYDINSILTWKINNKNNLKISYFTNDENLNSFEPDRSTITNIWIKNYQDNIGLKWENKKSENQSNELLAFADKYMFDLGQNQTDTTNSFKYINQLLSGIKSYGLIEKFKINYSNNLTSLIGGSLKVFGFSPIILNESDSTLNKQNFSNQQTFTESTLFTEMNYDFRQNKTLNAGIRVSTFGNSDTIFTSIEPRISFHGKFKNDYSLSSSVSYMTQPVHRVANPGLGFMFELFIPSGKGLLPQNSWNYSLGGAKDIILNKSKISLKVDAWYKSFQNIVEFKDGYDVLMAMVYKRGIINNNIEITTQGKGYAYGIDLSSYYTRKRLSITAGYTYMRAMNKFSELNNGNWFPASTDIHHSITLTGEYKISPNWTFNTTWQFRSGKPITVPIYVIAFPTYNTETGELDSKNGNYQFIENERNNFRTKTFHKLDISFTYIHKVFRKYDASLSLGVYNVYNRANPYLYFIAEGKNNMGQSVPTLKSMSLFPILPSFNWSIKF